MARKAKEFCQDTSEMTETEKGVMARAVKSGQEQINFLREQEAKKTQEDSDE